MRKLVNTIFRLTPFVVLCNNHTMKKSTRLLKDAFLHIRCDSADKQRWVTVARRKKIKLTKFVIEAANALAAK